VNGGRGAVSGSIVVGWIVFWMIAFISLTTCKSKIHRRDLEAISRVQGYNILFEWNGQITCNPVAIDCFDRQLLGEFVHQASAPTVLRAFDAVQGVPYVKPRCGLESYISEFAALRKHGDIRRKLPDLDWIRRQGNQLVSTDLISRRSMYVGPVVREDATFSQIYEMVRSLQRDQKPRR
jgi:hypothetical protein